VPTWEHAQRTADEHEPRIHDRLVINSTQLLEKTVHEVLRVLATDAR